MHRDGFELHFQGCQSPPDRPTSRVCLNWCSLKDLNLRLRVTSAVHRHECLESENFQFLNESDLAYWWAELDSNQRGSPGEVTARHLQPLGHPPKASCYTTSLALLNPLLTGGRSWIRTSVGFPARLQLATFGLSVTRPKPFATQPLLLCSIHFIAPAANSILARAKTAPIAKTNRFRNPGSPYDELLSVVFV